MTVDEITSYSSLEEGDKHNDIGSFENKQIPSEIEGFKVREMEKWNLQIGIFSGIHFDRLISFRVDETQKAFNWMEMEWKESGWSFGKVS